MIDPDLGQFIRSRREAIGPADVGLPDGPRRRTPGLRRAELAVLAGISVDYLVRLEQGRDRHPSAQVLAALADALRLGEDDRDHLRVLSICGSGQELCPTLPPVAQTVRPGVEAILGHLDPASALVLNRLADILAWTPAYERLVGPLGILDGPRTNLMWFTFTDPRAGDAYPEWTQVADEQVGNLRANLRPNDAEGEAFVAALVEAAGDEFTRRWEERPVARKRTGTKVLRQPEVGTLRISYETLQLPDTDDQRLVVYLPADAATATGLDLLNGRRPGGLRAVGGSIQ
ncbi:MAG: helix-turn-helix domain-containing protein [Acidimicrobiia bacterium]|nr:helix-turn-helix domain-containing protein [Acidimicrobiia bacterium]